MYVFVLQNPDYMYIGFLINICNNTDVIDKLTTRVTIVILVPQAVTINYRSQNNRYENEKQGKLR